MITPVSILCCYLIVGVFLYYWFIEVGGIERMAMINPDFSPRVLKVAVGVLLIGAWPVICFMMLLIAAFGGVEEE